MGDLMLFALHQLQTHPVVYLEDISEGYHGRDWTHANLVSSRQAIIRLRRRGYVIEAVKISEGGRKKGYRLVSEPSDE
jgi:hypothetical protein